MTPKPEPPARLLPAIFRQIEWAAETLRIPRERVVEKELKRFKARELSFDRIRVDLSGDDYRSGAQAPGSNDYEVFNAIVVLHYAPGRTWPHKGGIRMHDRIEPDLLRVFAVDMTFKNELVGVPRGGGKSGIVLNRPINEYSKRGLTKIVEAVATTLIDFRIIHPDLYVPATDYGTTPEHMDAINQRYWEMRGESISTPVTGRTPRNGGVPGRPEATARGALSVLRYFLEHRPPQGMSSTPTAVVQGLGQVGGNFARLAASFGLNVIGVSNATGGVYRPEGIDVAALPSDPNAPLDGVEGERCSTDDILLRPCDILFPAALENALHEGNANGVRAKIVLEGANHPTTSEADHILKDRGVCVIPDILANAGGVFVSWEEEKQSRLGPMHKIEEEALREKIEGDLARAMVVASQRVDEFSVRFANDLRKGEMSDLRGAAWIASLDGIAAKIRDKHGDRFPID